jgi:hypothetical protein
MVALARNLDFAGPRFLAGLTAVLFARLREALARKMCTLGLLSCRHRGSPFQKPKLSDCGLLGQSLTCSSGYHFRDLPVLRQEIGYLFPDGFFDTTDQFLNFAGLLFRLA